MDENLKRDAYLKGLKLKNTSLEEDIICIRLEKQGIPYELAKEVAKNVSLQRQVDAVNNAPSPHIGTPRGALIKQIVDEIKLWFQTKK